MRGGEPVEVTVEVDGREHVAGTLWVHERRGISTTFRYADTWLRLPEGYDVDPALRRGTGAFQTPPGKELFNAFADGAPDGWGQGLMRRQEAERARAAGETPRTLTPADFLLGTRDDLRQGAIRFREPGTTTYHAPAPDGVPRLVSLPHLLAAADAYVAGEPTERDVTDLLNAGGSLGGARPKAAVVSADGRLCIAKFPRSDDEWDVIAWEELAYRIARRAGVEAARTELHRIGKRNVIVVERFDRQGANRIGFASSLTMLEASDREEHSYLEIADAIGTTSTRAGADLEQLWRRIVFSVLVGNTDDHLRNHGFLRRGAGWRLSPAYDLNPNPDRPDHLTLAIDETDTTADVELARSVAPYFRVAGPRAHEIVDEVSSAAATWRDEAHALGIPAGEIDRVAPAFARVPAPSRPGG